jgi:hypothetical protein
VRTFLALALAVLPAAALAQQEDPEPVKHVEREVIIPETTEVDFERGADVTAKVYKPGQGFITGDPRREHKPLIRLRMDFNPELAASTDKIK